MIGKVLRNHAGTAPCRQEETHPGFDGQEAHEPDIVDSPRDGLAYAQHGLSSGAVDDIDISQADQEWQKAQNRVCSEWPRVEQRGKAIPRQHGKARPRRSKLPVVSLVCALI